MTRKLILIIILIFIAGMGVSLRAEPKPQEMMGHMGFNISMAEKNLFPPFLLLKIKDKIGLTKEQIEKIEKMDETFMEGAIKQKAEIKILELKLKYLLKEEKPDRKKVEQMVRQISGLKTDMKVSHLFFLFDVKNLLTQEQHQKIQDLMKERRHDRMGKKRNWKN